MHASFCVFYQSASSWSFQRHSVLVTVSSDSCSLIYFFFVYLCFFMLSLVLSLLHPFSLPCFIASPLPSSCAFSFLGHSQSLTISSSSSSSSSSSLPRALFFLPWPSLSTSTFSLIRKMSCPRCAMRCSRKWTLSVNSWFLHRSGSRKTVLMMMRIMIMIMMRRRPSIRAAVEWIDLWAVFSCFPLCSTYCTMHWWLFRETKKSQLQSMP